MFTLGITGGIGSGKSLVSDHFEKLGVYVVDADVVSRKVVEPGTTALTAIEKHFGETIIRADDSLDRKQLRKLIFDRQEDKIWLEDLLHPLIRSAVKARLKQPKPNPYQAYSAPLLLEQNQDGLVDLVLVVDCPVELQLKRAVMRDGATKEGILKVIQQQLGRDERLKRADFIIDNSGAIATTLKQVSKLHQHFLKLCKSDIYDN